GKSGTLGPVPAEFVFERGFDFIFHHVRRNGSGGGLLALERDSDCFFQKGDLGRRLDLPQISDLAFDVLEHVNRVSSLLRLSQRRIEISSRQYPGNAGQFFGIRSRSELWAGPSLLRRLAFRKK